MKKAILFLLIVLLPSVVGFSFETQNDKLPRGNGLTDPIILEPSDKNSTSFIINQDLDIKSFVICKHWNSADGVCDAEWVYHDVDFEKVSGEIILDKASLLKGLDLSASQFDVNGIIIKEAISYAIIPTDIIITNPQSYPIVGGGWETRFRTFGTENLIIIPWEGTTWDDESANPKLYDLRFEEVACGDEVQKSQFTLGIMQIANYHCDEMSFHRVSVWTQGKHAQLLNFGDQNAIARNLAGDVGMIIDRNATDTSIATGSTGFMAELDSSLLTAGQDYLIFGSVFNYNSDAAARGRIDLLHGGSIFTDRRQDQENAASNSVGLVYSAVEKWGAVSGESIEMRTTCLVAGDTCNFDEVFLMALPLANLDQNTDWYYADENTNLANMNNTFSSNIGAFITFTPDGTSDYLVMGTSRILVDATANNLFKMELHDGSSQLAIAGRDGEDTADTSVLSILNVIDTPSASPLTLSLRFQGDSTHDHDDSSVFILRLDAFNQHDFNVSTDVYNITTSTYFNVGTTNLARNEDGNVVAFSGSTFDHENGANITARSQMRSRGAGATKMETTGSSLASWNDVDATAGSDEQSNITFDTFNVDTTTQTYGVDVKTETGSGSHFNQNTIGVAAVFSTAFATGDLNFSFDHPQADSNSSVLIDTNFLVNGTVFCNNLDCGIVDINLQACQNVGCTTFFDVNMDSSNDVYIASDVNTHSFDLNVGDSIDVNWVVRGTTFEAYELRLVADGTQADVNTTSGTDKTIEFQNGEKANQQLGIILKKDIDTQTLTLADGVVSLLSIEPGRLDHDLNYLIFASVDKTPPAGDNAIMSSYLRSNMEAIPDTNAAIFIRAGEADNSFTFIKMVPAFGDDIELVGVNSQFPANDANFDEAFLMALPLDDGKDLNYATDWFWDSNSTTISNMSDTFADNVGSRITFTPDGISDYVVFGTGSVLQGGTANTLMRMQLWDGSSELSLSERDPIDTLACCEIMSLFHLLENPVASPITLSLRFQGDTVHDHNESRMFILRLDALDLNRFNQVDENYEITNTESIRATISGALNEDGNVVVFWGSSFEHTKGVPLRNRVKIDGQVDSSHRVGTELTLNTSTNDVDNSEGSDQKFNIHFDAFDTDTSTHSYGLALTGEAGTDVNRHNSRQAKVVVFSEKLRPAAVAPVNFAPDVNVTKIEGVDVNTGMPTFRYSDDGNLTITFNVSDQDQDDLNFNMWYSVASGGLENSIIADINLGLGADIGNCASTDWTTTRTCTFDWNIISVTDANYFIDIILNDGTTTDTSSSDQNFAIDNVVVTDDGMFWGQPF